MLQVLPFSGIAVRRRIHSFFSFLAVGILAIFAWSFITGIENPLHSAGPDETTVERISSISLPKKRVRVEVLNGSGIPGAARAAANRLRDRGFDVVYIGNADHFNYDQTEIISRTDDTGSAKAVARALDAARIRNDPDSMLVLEVTVILGRDWQRPGR